MNRNARLVAPALCLVVAACSGGAGGDNDSSGGSSGGMDVATVTNGFGPLLPHRVFRLGSNGQPTGDLVEIRSVDDLVANVRANNPVQPTPLMPSGATLPNGQPGNQYLAARFTRPIEVESVITGAPGAQANAGLTGAISIVAIDPTNGSAAPVSGRAFVGGRTFAGTPTGTPLALPLQRWVELDAGAPVASDVDGNFPGLGFPGTQGIFSGAELLVGDDTFVFVVDSDNNLTTHESFPANRHIQMRITEAVRSTNGQDLVRPALASTILGTDNVLPEVAITPPPTLIPQITPGNGDSNVDPLTQIRVQFNEPVQPLSVGALDDGTSPTVSSSVTVEFGPSTARTRMPFAVLPVSVYDLSTYDLRPVFNFPGAGPAAQPCGTFNQVDISVVPGLISDLVGNLNSQSAVTSFTTGDGPALVNAVVIPDAIYAGRLGAVPGLSVLDLNGFGQGTGNPEFDATLQNIQPGQSNFPNNPNVRFQGSQLRPPLALGSCTFDGGSAGVFTLTRDSSLEDLLVRPPLITGLSDMMLGHALDIAFNNGPSPFGCQSGGQNVGGNICAQTGTKQVAVVISGSTLSPAASNQTQISTIVNGAENLITWAPQPNPPPLIFPPPCISPFINGQEPTSVDTTVPNLLVPGDPFGIPSAGIPASGLLPDQQNGFFEGPSLPAAMASACTAYALRQQVGHFLYVTDRARREVVILNSNRMTVVDRIEMPDPTYLAIGTNLDFLAVSNRQSDSVIFLDTDPNSSNFHEIVRVTGVGDRPAGIAWEPGNEDILVANEGSNSMSIISAFSLQVRKTVSANLNEPFDIAITPRQANFGLQRNVYFAYVANRNGRVVQFESGPSTVNGWGYDDMIGSLPYDFRNLKAIQPDHLDLRSGFWIAHEGPLNPATGAAGTLGEGAVSNIVVSSGLAGQLPFGLLGLLIPQFRDMNHAVIGSLGENILSGVPVDLAFDDLLNRGGSVNYATSFSAGAPINVNGKSIVRVANAANNTTHLFLAVPNPPGASGVIDVVFVSTGVRRDTNPFVSGVQSVPAPNVNVLMDFFRQ